jgi:hypothetical protein
LRDHSASHEPGNTSRPFTTARTEPFLAPDDLSPLVDRRPARSSSRLRALQQDPSNAATRPAAAPPNLLGVVDEFLQFVEDMAVQEARQGAVDVQGVGSAEAGPGE